MDDMDDMDMENDMSQYFSFSKSDTVLFEKWKFDSLAGLIGSMFAVYAMAFTYEGLKFYRSYLLTSAITIRDKNRASGEERFTKLTILSKSHLIQTLFHGIQAVLSYFLMLIFMTYNGGLCLAVVFGLVCGYFVFGWRSPLVNSAIADDHCS